MDLVRVLGHLRIMSCYSSSSPKDLGLVICISLVSRMQMTDGYSKKSRTWCRFLLASSFIRQAMPVAAPHWPWETHQDCRQFRSLWEVVSGLGSL